MSERTTSHAQRVEIIERHTGGEAVAHIAQALGLSSYTVRKWWRRYRDASWPALVPKPSGPPPTGPLSGFAPRVKYVALRLKRQHPAWGLDLLLLELSRRPSLSGYRLPGRTALYNYLHRFHPRLQAHRRPRTRRPGSRVAAVQTVHERWQIDFKGDDPIVGLGLVRPLIVCDEYTSAPLAGRMHRAPDADTPPLTFRDVQADLRLVFTQWGRPLQLRMDRDPLWVGSTRLEWPGTLLLWLVGLDITPLINHPGRPTENAQVERCNRTWHEHVALGVGCTSLHELQTRTDQAWADRRAALPSRNRLCHGLPPLRAFPHLAHPWRLFAPECEAALFDMQRVYSYLATWEWARKVDLTGSISLAAFNRRVSRAHVGQIVKVRFDLEARLFVARAVDGAELRRFHLPIISADYILGTKGGHNR
jgi:hypothetical protein